MIEETLLFRAFKSTLLLCNHTLTGNIFSIPLVIFWVSVAIALYWIFYVPVTWTKDLCEVGYAVDSKLKGMKKKSEINRIRRLRKIGHKLPPPYPNGWFRVIASDQLKAGQAMSVDCLGEHFAIFRSEQGIIHILDAYCPHLGANLGVGGKVRGDCIECPFHHWSFRGTDGTCNNIPYTTSTTIPKAAAVKSWKSCEVNDEVFVWYHAEGAMPWTMPIIREVQDKEWIFYGENEFIVNCHIQDVPENGADVAHLNAVHTANVLVGGDLRNSEKKWGSFARHIWGGCWKPPSSDDNEPAHISTVNISHGYRLFNKIELYEVNVDANQIGPGYVVLYFMTPYGKMVIVQSVTPLEPLMQKITHRFYGPRWLSLFGKISVYSESLMVERDIMMWNNKIYIDNPCLMKEDKFIKIYRQWYRQFYSENSVEFSMANESNLSW